MNRARMLITLCIVIAVGMASPTPVFSQDNTIVVCQNKKKKKKIKLRPDGCTSKEDQVLDLTDVLTGDGTTESRITDIESRTTDIESRTMVVESRITVVESRTTDIESRITDMESRITVVERYLGLVCEGDPSRTVFAGKSGTGACEQFNGDRGGCESAFESLDLGEGAISCFFDLDEECWGCGLFQENSGWCTNSCT